MAFKEMKRFLLLAIYCSVLIQIDGYNIETHSDTLKSFVHQIREDDVVSEIGDKRFFGYTFETGRINIEEQDIVSMMIAAPLEHVLADTTTEEPDGNGEAIPVLKAAVTYTKSTGVLYNCGMMVNNFQNMSTSINVLNCSNKQPFQRSLSGFDLADNDTLGISMTSDSSKSAKITSDMPKDRMVACAHLRAHNCGESYKAEGTCYVSNVEPGRGDGRYSVEWNEKTPCRQSCFEKSIDLMFLVDGSESITKKRFETVKDWVIDVAAGFDISEEVQIGVVQYSHWWRDRKNQKWLRTEIPLGEHHDHASFAKAVRNISYHGFTTYTAHAIEKTVRDDFNGLRSRYPQARRVMILLTDGNSTDKESLPSAVRYAESEGVTSFAVGVKGYVLGELELIAGARERVITVDDFDQLLGIVSRIQQGIQVMEGNTNSNITNDLMQCQAGISSDLSLVSIQANKASLGSNFPIP
uniref:integrin alpha-X-like n=1 Tax=Styela clava TaxID=7725 RepID=UPI001939532B|nr:integrin alpha-X-like [Styela clava]